MLIELKENPTIASLVCEEKTTYSLFVESGNLFKKPANAYSGSGRLTLSYVNSNYVISYSNYTDGILEKDICTRTSHNKYICLHSKDFKMTFKNQSSNLDLYRC